MSILRHLNDCGGGNPFSHMLMDAWDPDNSLLTFGMGNATFNISKDKDGKVSFSRGVSAPYYKYKNHSGEDEDILDHIYFNAETGSIYYPDKNGNYVKHNETIAPGFTGSAWDSEITPIARNIAKKLKGVVAAPVDLGEGVTATEAPIPVQNPVYTQVTPVTTPEEDKKKAEEEAKKAAEKAKIDAQNAAAAQTILAQSQVPVQEVKDDTVYYNFGPHQFDLKYYIHNLGANLQGYLDSKKNWTQAQKDAFIKAYETQKVGLNEQLSSKGNRFYADDSGLTRDTQGQISGKNDRMFVTADGQVFKSLDEIKDKKLRKTAKEFSPNDELGIYMKAIGNKIVSAGKTKGGSEGGDFDFNQHGFQHYWANKVNPGGGQIDLNPYLNLDAADESGKRGTTNRANYLANELQNYLTYTKNKRYKYTGTPYETADNYYARVQAAIDNLRNGWDPSDAASLQQAGITADFYNGFFHDGVSPRTEAEAAAQEAKATEEKLKAEQLAEIEDQHAHIVGLLNKHEQWAQSNINNYTRNNPHIIEEAGVTENNWVDTLKNVLKNHGYEIELSNSDNPDEQLRMQQEFQLSYTKFKNTVLSALRGGQKNVVMPDGLTYPATQLTKYLIPILVQEGDMKLDSESGLYFYNSPRDFETNSILVYDPTTKEAYYTFVGDVKSCAAWLKYKNDYTTSKQKKDGSFRYSFKQGGTIEVPKYEGGARFAELAIQPLASLAKENGRSINNQRLKNRELNGLATMLNPDNGAWKGEDYARMGAIGADIVSLFLDPISATAVNVGSTLTHFGADWADDSVNTTDMFKNLAANLGMDALSFVPIIGDAAGTGTKLAKSLKWAAPKLMYAMATYGGLATLKNAGNIKESLGKVMSDEKLTVGDYQNIAQAISAIVGVGNMAKAKLGVNNAKQQVIDELAIGLKVKNTSTGKSEDLIFRGELAKTLREKIQTKNPEEVNKFLHSLEDLPGMKFSEFEVSTSLASIRPHGQKPWETVTNADGTTSKSGRSPFYMERKIDAFDIFDPAKKASGYYTSDNLVDRSRSNAAKETNAMTKAEVDALQDTQFKEMTQRAHDMTVRRREKIAEVEEAIFGKKNEDGTRAGGGAEQRYKDAKAKEAATNSAATAARKAVQDIDLARSRGYSSSLVDEAAVTKASSKLEKDIRRKLRDIDPLEVKEEAGTINAAESAQLATKRREMQRLVDEKKKLDQWVLDYGDVTRNKAIADANIAEAAKTKLDADIALYDTDLKKLRDRLKQLDLSINSTNEKAKIEALLTNPIEIKDASGRTVRSVTANINDLMTKYDFMKKGGRFQFLKEGDLVKYSGKGNAGNVTYDNNIDWYNNYIREGNNYSQEAKDVYGGINEANMEEYNKMQNESYRKIFAIGSTNPASGRGSALGDDADTRAHQTTYNKLANRLNQRFNTMKGLGRLPGAMTADSEAGGWVDGRKGTMTWLRHLGDKQEHVNAINTSGMLKNGMEAFWNDKSQMVNFRKKASLGTESNGGTTPSESYEDYTDYGREQVEEKPNTGNNNNSGILQFMSGIKENLPWALRAARLGKLNADTLESGDRWASHIRSYQLRYNWNPLRVSGKGELLAQGENDFAAMVSPFQNAPLTSDGAKQTGAYMDAVEKGIRLRDEKREKYNDSIDASREKAELRKKANDDLRLNIVNQNILQDVKAQIDKFRILDTAKDKVTKNTDNAMQEGIYYALSEADEIKGMRRAMDKEELNTAVTYNPLNFGVKFEPDEERVYQAALAGNLPDSSNSSDLNALARAKQKVAAAKNDALRRQLGLGVSPYGNSRFMTVAQTGWDPTLVEIAKDGSKIQVAKIKEKMENARRFLDSVNKGNERHHKKLMKISDRMYGLPKSEVIKAK